MKKEQIINFAAGIISNGVESKLPNEKIMEGLATYIEYLQSQNFVDKEAMTILKSLPQALPELVKVASVFGSNGIANLMLNNNVQATPAVAQPREVIREVVRTETVSASSCSGGRGLGKSSC